ncbi:MAG: hypothetical protein FJ241_11000 [Nitrospira sp.]|nr:hypothetical protein [Nitrospira sp.]
MRDPKRIFRIMKLISKIWKANPDLRLSQLLLNAIREDMFTYWLEDDNLENALKYTYNIYCKKDNDKLQPKCCKKV